MTRRRILGFLHQPTGEWRELIDPDGQPSGGQLQRLNRDGRIEIVPPGTVEPWTKAELAAAIDDAVNETAGRSTA